MQLLSNHLCRTFQLNCSRFPICVILFCTVRMLSKNNMKITPRTMDLLLKDIAGNGQSQRSELVELDKPDQRFNVLSGY